MNCNQCGLTLAPGQATCPECGAEMPSIRNRRSASHNYADPEQAVLQTPRQAPGPDEVPRRLPVRKNNSLAPPERPKNDPPARERSTSSAKPDNPIASTDAVIGALPDDGLPPTVETDPETGLRMVRHHAYQALGPTTKGYDRFNWIRMCIIAFVCIVILAVGLYYYLSRSTAGQLWLASLDREATKEAYHELGRKYMVEGSIARAVHALEIAQSKDPDNFEVLIDLGKAYMGNNQPAEAELAYTRAIQFNDKYPEAYRLVINIMLDQDRKFEAMECAKLAYEKTEDTYFNTVYGQLIPPTPNASPLGGRHETIQEITLTCGKKVENADDTYIEEEGVTILYNIRGEDPKTNGTVYTEPFELSEGGWKVRAVATRDGVYSAETVQSYTIIKPSPDMPVASLAPNTYDTVKTVSLRAGKDVVAIYYTIDGTAPSDGKNNITPNATLFTDPIQLRVGKTKLRAVAVNAEGKVSNELVREYECKGRTKVTMEETDTIDKMALYKTTQEEFIAAHGQPLSEQPDGSDSLGEYTRLAYAFGYAVFLTRNPDKPAVLAELSVNSSEFSGPRSTAVGKRTEDVLDAFRDVGGEMNAQNTRILYNLTTGKLGLYKLLDDTHEQISYYLKLDNGQYVELSYYATDGLIERIEWLRYSTQ